MLGNKLLDALACRLATVATLIALIATCGSLMAQDVSSPYVGVRFALCVPEEASLESFLADGPFRESVGEAMFRAMSMLEAAPFEHGDLVVVTEVDQSDQTESSIGLCLLIATPIRSNSSVPFKLNEKTLGKLHYFDIETLDAQADDDRGLKRWLKKAGRKLKNVGKDVAKAAGHAALDALAEAITSRGIVFSQAVKPAEVSLDGDLKLVVKPTRLP